MTKLTITGNTTPTVGIIETYALSVFDHSAPPNVFQPNLSKKAEWYIEILEKGSWKKSKGDYKEGDAVTFRFSQRSLSRKAIKIVVKRGEDKGELLIKPQRAKEAKITRVELLDENYQPIPKGKILNYHDTLIARAHCVEMFWNYISFTLWEDDAKGEGHDPVMNMMNKINPIPLRGEVNEKGIAEVTFRLPFYTMAVQIANAHIAAGDTDEGPTHEYYVTAELVSKHIMKASSNVNVANPTHIPPAPPSKTSSNTPEEKPQKSKPKADTPKFPITSSGKKQADPNAKILNAEFLNERGQPIEKAEVGDTVIIKITTQNMKGRNVTVRIWEEETGYKTYDKIYEKKWVLPGNENFIKVLITKRIYELGITPEDMANEKYDYKFQVYFIEVEPDNTHVTSQVIPISKTAPKLEVENSPSPAIIKKVKEEKEDKVCEYEARVRAFMRMLRYKEGTEGESGYTKLFGHSNFTKPPHNKDMSTHPDISIPFGRTSSNAAGAYQIMGDTYKNLKGYFQQENKKWVYSEKLDKAKKYKITSFDQESQDKFCLVILKHNYLQDRAASFYNPIFWKDKAKTIHDTEKETKAKEWRKRFKGQQGDIIQMIIDNDIKKAALISSLCWASLPDAPYGQQSSAYTFAIVKAIYDKYLREELIQPNKELHLKKGFLKEFGYGCCGDMVKEEPVKNENNCSADSSQCFEYADVVNNPKINNQSGNKNHNRYNNEPRTKANGKKYYHSGTDILTSVGTEIHSMMCGEVVHVRTDLPQNDYIKGYESPTSYGNTITIKSKDKNGKLIYHFYAHLSKVNVKVGEIIKHNKIIGLSGSTDNAMHVEVKYRHVHVEAGTSYSTTGGTNGKQRCKIHADLNPENYMKSKFDNKGNTL